MGDPVSKPELGSRPEVGSVPESKSVPSAIVDTTRVERRVIADRYQIVAEIGRGGMAVVYLVRTIGNPEFSKLAVIKRPLSASVAEAEDSEDVTAHEMFADEVRLAARLNHNNIVQTFETGKDNEGPYVVMEFLEGKSLSALLRRAKKNKVAIPRSLLLASVSETLGALEYAHDLADHDGSPLNIVHRDVSPSNIFLTYQGRVKLVDFGIAKAVDSHKTQAGMFKGKIAYMAPEQATQATDIDRRADIFSVGIVLWELLTGQRFWGKTSDFDIMHALVLGNIPLPASTEPVPESLLAICRKAVSASPTDRYKDASEMQEALDAAIADEKLGTSTKQIATFLSDLFANDRAQLKASIEAATREGLSGGLAPNLGDISSAMRGQGSYSQAGAIPPEMLAGAARTAAPAPSKTPIIVGGALAAVGLLGVFIALNRKPAEVTQPPSSPVSETVNAVLPLATRGQTGDDVTLEVSVTPLSASITLDGRALGANPFRGKMPRDEAEHTLVISAQGYDPRNIPIKLDKDRALDVNLKGNGQVRWVVPQPKGSGAATAAKSATAPVEQPKPAAGGVQELTRPDVRGNQRSIDTDILKK